MSNTGIKYKEFVKYVHQKFETEIALQEVEEILFLEEGYNKDNPTSLGKSLVINRVIISGKKITGEEIKYDQALNRGINVWIADNHKGKSTIFKIIKFALTGKDSLKPDIKPWINEILLEFNIGKNTYTCNINRTGRDSGALYSFSIERFINLKNNQKLDIIEKEKEFDFKTNTQFQEKIQEFFFEQFSFYTLKYTSHKSGKDEFGLNTGNLSWVTYFKSIYLESKNYEYLFFDKEDMGAQGRKIFEMILGLPLTYPINMLGIQRDKVLEMIGKLKLTDKSKIETSKTNKEKIINSFATVNKELENLKIKDSISFDEKPLIEEYNRIQEKVNNVRKDQRAINELLQKEKSSIELQNEELQNLIKDKQKIDLEINKLAKHELNIELYQQAESFFSNLDIKICPHCEIEISDEKKKTEIENHVCGLCGEKPTQQKVEEPELLEKVNRIKSEREGYLYKLFQIEKTINLISESIEQKNILVTNYYTKIISPLDNENENRRLNEIEVKIEAINNERKAQVKEAEIKLDLIQKQAVLKFQVDEIEKEKLSENEDEINKLCLRKDILEEALNALEKKRIQLNKTILSKLEQLILNEIHAFGLQNISEIKINDKFDLIFIQNGVKETFNELNEGEKLRVKLAFYLSLIQLDIEHQLGRHPRFLIFDSPGSEEMVPKHLQGLSGIFKNINLRFKDQLQIFVGTALREFSHITDKEKTYIKNEDEYFF
jgi:hypothetical protein